MRCVRVHRARRAAQLAHAACATGVALALAGNGTPVRAQQPGYPAPTHPTYPAPQNPQHPQYPQVPQHPAPPYPQGPQYPHPGHPAAPPVAGTQPYRLPMLTLAQPSEGTSLPEDMPVAVFRFAALEPGDPLDALSFAVSVGGIDRTSLFRLTHGEAWGRLAPPDAPLRAGQHEVRARICSTRGACTSLKALVHVGAGDAATTSTEAAAAAGGPRLRMRVLDAVLRAARVLIQ